MEPDLPEEFQRLMDRHRLRPESLPPLLQREIEGWTWEQVRRGCSGAALFRLHQPGEAGPYLKIGHRYEAHLAGEKRRLKWLRGRLPVPEVLLFARDQTSEYLLMGEIPGIPASDARHGLHPEPLAHLLAAGLKQIHAVPIEGCPFDQTLDQSIAAAARRVKHGLVDESDFDPPRAGRTAQDLFAELLRTRPQEEDIVFTHGDYCLPNILIRDGRVSGFVDWGHAGVADRYQDLALAARSLAYNFGPEWVPALLQAYGIPEPDPAKMEFYQLLDEFF